MSTKLSRRGRQDTDAADRGSFVDDASTATTVLGTRQRARRARMVRSGYGAGLPWILPAVALVVGMIYFSIGYTGFVSTREWTGFILTPSIPVGGENFARMTQDATFWAAIWHTVFFFVITFVVQTAIGFTFAALVHSKIWLAPVYRVLIFIPTILAPATMAPVFRSIFDTNGAFNEMLRTIGLGFIAQPWLAGETTAMMVVMAVTIWQWTGLTFILFYAAMSQIEPEILEAARVDGASNFRSLVAIVWPMCRGTTIALATLGVIGALKTFDVPFLITKGGPNHATEFLGTYIYQTMVQDKEFGYAAAISVALLLLAVVCGVLVRLRSRKES